MVQFLNMLLVTKHYNLYITLHLYSPNPWLHNIWW